MEKPLLNELFSHGKNDDTPKVILYETRRKELKYIELKYSMIGKHGIVNTVEHTLRD